MNKIVYEADFYGWANEQAALLRDGRLNEADIENIAEEIESMGRSEKRELVSRLTVLLTHLLKWRFQPVGRGSSWRTSIVVQRRALDRHLTDNPSLKPRILEAVDSAYRDAILIAGDETKLGESVFPQECPWTFEDIANPDFWPT
ncbi:MAG TPA: DUF29 domain-containing protein [Beijerinckiaceae bacterium]|jgi:hypothetical protein|nr:DUF29 domain-containing protein [Beijerinckiaceae bacterium]